MKKYIQFDLEQQILQCWNICDELKLLNELVLEKNISRDDTSNIVMGLETLYQHKFDKCFQLFEDLLAEYHSMKQDLKSLKQEDSSDNEDWTDSPFIKDKWNGAV